MSGARGQVMQSCWASEWTNSFVEFAQPAVLIDGKNAEERWAHRKGTVEEFLGVGRRLFAGQICADQGRELEETNPTMDTQQRQLSEVLDVMIEAELAIKYLCYPRAIQILSDVIGVHPDYLPAREILCDIYQQTGDLESASRLAEEMTAIRSRLAQQAAERKGGLDADEPTRRFIARVDGIVRDLYEAKDELVVLKLAAERLLGTVGGDRCLILRIGKGTGTAKHYEHCRTGVGASLESRTARLNFLLLKMVPADGELLVIPDTSEAPALRECRRVLDEFQIRSVVAVPLAYKSTRMGLVIVHYCSVATELNGQAGDILLAAVGHLAVALRNAQRLASAPAHGISEEIPGLSDKQLFEERLSAELKASQQQNYPLCLAYLFLENVDGIRDSCNPEALTRMLHKVGLLVRTHIRKGSVITRTREDEFAIILPNLSRIVAHDVLGNIKKLVEHTITVEVGSGISLRLGIFEAAAASALPRPKVELQVEDTCAPSAETVLLRGVFPLSDVIQMLETSQKTGALTATAGSEVGIVYLNHGRIVNSVYRNESGESAFFTLFAQIALKPASLEFSPSLASFPELIASSNAYLLLEGLRLIDEAGRESAETEIPTG